MNQENVVITSPRRVGKTGLVYHCFNRPAVKEQYVTISIDILHTTSFQEFIKELGTAVFNSVAKRSDRLMKMFTATLRSLSGSFGYDPVHNLPTFDVKLGQISTPEYTLDEIFDYLEQADKPCIVAIDEFQQIMKYGETNMEALLRGRIQKLKNSNFIFAGSERRIMNEMFFSDKRPFFQSSALLQLEPIDLSVYTEFAVRHFQEAARILSKRLSDGPMANTTASPCMYTNCCTMPSRILKREQPAPPQIWKGCQTCISSRMPSVCRNCSLMSLNSRRRCFMQLQPMGGQTASHRVTSSSVTT